MFGRRFITFICLSWLFGGNCNAYKILVVLTYPGKSHFITFTPLIEELVRKGHNITLISPFSLSISPEFYTHIDLKKEYPPFVNVISFDQLPHNVWQKFYNQIYLSKIGVNVCKNALSSSLVQNFLKSSDTYDLILLEYFNSFCDLAFVQKFNVPFIGLSSCVPLSWVYDYLGNPNNPSYIPNVISYYDDMMTFFERLENTILTIWTNLVHSYYSDIIIYPIVRKQFAEELPSLRDIATNISLLLTNSHFSVIRPKPTLPTVIDVLGMHISTPKHLPKNIEKWINDSKDGVIYFSMGSMIKGHTFPEEKRQIFMRAFGRLPQRVLWKWESDTMPGKPDNVMIQKWMPQFDILCHPNVKAYISHGGLLGTTEAVHCGVPAVVMPQFGDQHTNAKALEASGGGVVLNFNDLTEEIVYDALKTILEPSFQKQTKELSERFRDRPLPPLETAVYWVEYVARHKGARHMRTAAVDMPLYKYLLLDVIGFLLIVFLSILGIVYVTLRAIFRKLFVKNKTKMKEN